MSFPVEAFWKLVVEGQLLSLDECHQYHAAWAAQNPHGDAQSLAEWLVAQNVISRYQASILLAGRGGPFIYGDYKIYDRIESGRLKGIFRALHMPTMHTVCLQFLTPEQAVSPDNVARLSYQAALVSRTSAGFPHLLRCYHLVDLGTYKFFVLEDLQGKRIERILTQKGALPQSEACRVARQAALGLSRLHAMQQAHGDLRPANIWVDAGGTVKLLQFPLSRDPLSAPIDWRRLLSTADAKAPPEADYVAPELLSGAKPDARSDIYQLGCSLYTMLTNRPPFPATSLREKLEGHLKGQPTPIEQINPSVAPALGKVVAYMMSKKPDMRYQQAASVIEKLLPFMTAADAQSQPTAPTRAAQLYDAWLSERLGAAAPTAAPQAVVPPMMPPGPVPQAAAAAPMMPQAAAGFPTAAAPPMPMSPGPGVAPPPRLPAGPRVGAPSPSAVRRRRSSGAGGLIVVLLVIAGLGGGAAYVFRDKLFGPKPPIASVPSAAVPTATKPKATGAAPTATASATAQAAAPKGAVVTARDTMTALGDPMWDSPTAGKPLALNYLTRGVSMVVAFRPAELVKQPETERLLDEKVLGPIGAWVHTTLPAWAGTTNDNIEQVVVGLMDGNDAVRTACVIHLKSAADEAALVTSWGNPAAEDVEGAKIYVGADRAFYLPAAGQGKVIVTAPKEDLVDSLTLKGAPAPLSRRELDYFVQNATDGDRQLTILYSPHYLTSGGKSLTTGALGKGLDALNWLFTGVGLASADGAAPMPIGTDAEPPKAVLLSAQLTDDGGARAFFWELRLYNAGANALTEGVVKPLADRVKEVPQRVESYVLSLGLSPYSRAVLFKFPRMVRFVCDNVRAAAADKQFVLRGYLPDVAAHNVVLGAYLCLIESPGGVVVAAAPQNGGAAAPPKQTGALETLRTKKIMLAFDRNDLNKVLDIVSQEIGVPIEMVGTDFQLAGITKNQSMGLNEAEQPADELLRKILMKANPDGQLVYMAKPNAEGVETIYIATRKGMADRKEPLLPEFVNAPVKK